ncbi:8383_t:CDS:2, partial [Scutellospora calospora]
MNNQPVQPQNLAHNIPQNTNTSFDNLTAVQKFEILDKEDDNFYKDQSINNHSNNYNQILAWVKEQVKSIGKLNLPFDFKGGSWIVGTYQNDDAVPPLVKSSPCCISRGSLPRRMSVFLPRRMSVFLPRNIHQASHYVIEVKRMNNQPMMRVHKWNEYSVVERCANIASNVKRCCK